MNLVENIMFLLRFFLVFLSLNISPLVYSASLPKEGNQKNPCKIKVSDGNGWVLSYSYKNITDDNYNLEDVIQDFTAKLKLEKKGEETLLSCDALARMSEINYNNFIENIIQSLPNYGNFTNVSWLFSEIKCILSNAKLLSYTGKSDKFSVDKFNSFILPAIKASAVDYVKITNSIGLDCEAPLKVLNGKNLCQIYIEGNLENCAFTKNIGKLSKENPIKKEYKRRLQEKKTESIRKKRQKKQKKQRALKKEQKKGLEALQNLSPPQQEKPASSIGNSSFTMELSHNEELDFEVEVICADNADKGPYEPIEEVIASSDSKLLDEKPDTIEESSKVEPQKNPRKKSKKSKRKKKRPVSGQIDSKITIANLQEYDAKEEALVALDFSTPKKFKETLTPKTVKTPPKANTVANEEQLLPVLITGFSKTKLVKESLEPSKTNDEVSDLQQVLPEQKNGDLTAFSDGISANSEEKDQNSKDTVEALKEEASHKGDEVRYLASKKHQDMSQKIAKIMNYLAADGDEEKVFVADEARLKRFLKDTEEALLGVNRAVPVVHPHVEQLVNNSDMEQLLYLNRVLDYMLMQEQLRNQFCNEELNKERLDCAQKEKIIKEQEAVIEELQRQLKEAQKEL